MIDIPVPRFVDCVAWRRLLMRILGLDPIYDNAERRDRVMASGAAEDLQSNTPETIIEQMLSDIQHFKKILSGLEGQVHARGDVIIDQETNEESEPSFVGERLSRSASASASIEQTTRGRLDTIGNWRCLQAKLMGFQETLCRALVHRQKVVETQREDGECQLLPTPSSKYKETAYQLEDVDISRSRSRLTEHLETITSVMSPKQLDMTYRMLEIGQQIGAGELTWNTAVMATQLNVIENGMYELWIEQEKSLAKFEECLLREKEELEAGITELLQCQQSSQERSPLIPQALHESLKQELVEEHTRLQEKLMVGIEGTLMCLRAQCTNLQLQLDDLQEIIDSYRNYRRNLTYSAKAWKEIFQTAIYFTEMNIAEESSFLDTPQSTLLHPPRSLGRTQESLLRRFFSPSSSSHRDRR